MKKPIPGNLQRRVSNSFLSAFFALVFLASTGWSQTITLPAANTDGTNSGDNSYANNPFGVWYDFERTHLLYTAAEHGLSNRRITAIGFYVNSIGGSPQNSNVTIRMKATTNTIVSATSYATAITGATTVFTGTITAASLSAGNWRTVTLSTPFDLTGSTNSIEIFIESDKVTNYDANGQSKVFRWSNPGAVRAQTWQQDGTPPTGNGTTNSLRANIQMTHTALVSACSGTPVGGTSAASPSTLSCPGLSTSLSVTGYSPETNITLQWQQRPISTGVWVNISGATSQNLSINPVETTDYRCNVTCTNSSLTTASSISTVTVSASPVNLPYSESFETLVTSMNQAFPLGCILNEFVSGSTSNQWVGSNGTSGTNLTARTGSKCVYSKWNFVGYMHLPSVAMTSGSTYRLTFWYKHAQSSGNPSLNFDVRIGNAPLASAQTTVLQTFTNQNNTAYAQAQIDFVCTSSGNYNFSIRNNATTSNPWEFVVDDIQIIDLNNCSGTPNPGTTNTSLSSVCPSQGFDLSTSNLLTATGLTFKWQRSTTLGGTYNDIPGATLNALAGQTQPSAFYYRLSATCTNSGLTGTSTPVLVSQNSLLDCYCVPPSTNCNLGDRITNLTFGTLNNNSSCGTNGYTKYVNTAPDMVIGSVQNISVTVGSGASSGVVGFWADWNQSGTFETTEYTAIGVSPNGGGTLTANITVPMSATLGNTRIRVRLKGEKTNINDLANNEACSNFGIYIYGETEDYVINIQAQPACTGTPNPGTPIPATVGACTGGAIGSLTYTGFTSGFSGLSFQWQTSTDDATWVDVSGQTSVSYNPGTYGGGPLYYRLIQTCSNSGQTGNGASIPVGVSSPTTQSSSMTFPVSSFTSFTASWTNGNGAKRLVYINSTNSFTNPTGAPGTANTVWQNAGEQLVYNGTGNSVSVTGLADGSTYYVRIFEYNECPIGSPTSWLYNVNTAFANPNSIDLPAVFSYNFSESAGTYSPISGGSVLGAGLNLDEHVFGSATPTAGSLASTTGLPIGFNFNYQGINYDRFGASINGYIKLGTGTFGIPSNYLNNANAIASTGGDNFNIIAGFHTDLFTDPAAGSELRYQTLGTPGSRTFVIQYKNFRMYPGTNTDLVTFQIRLSEGSNAIQVVYNSLNTSPSLPTVEAVVGLKGISVTPSADNTSLRSTRVSVATLANGNMGKTVSTHSPFMIDGVTVSNTVSPFIKPFNFNGLTYSWTPSTCKLAVPVSIAPSPIGSVTATLNWGLVAGASSYDVRWRLFNQDGTSIDSTTAGSWATATNVVTNSFSISGLYPNSIYIFEVAARCGVTRTEFSLTRSFTTAQATDDVGLNGIILTPDPETNSSCNTLKTVNAVIKNNGTATLLAGTAIPVTIQVTGTVTQTVSGSYTLISNLATNTSVTGAIGTLDMSVVGAYTFNGTTNWGGDQNPFNDALTVPVTKSYTKIAPAKGTYVQGFNSGTIWRAVQNAGTGVWANLANNLSFPSISPFEGNGTAFFNSFVFPAGTSSTLYSPCIELPDTCYVVRFRHSRDNSVSAALTEGTTLKVSTDGVFYTTLPLKNLSTGRDTTFARRYYGPATSPTWHEFEADLSAYSNQTITLAFEGTGNAGYNFAIDNVALIPVSANDVGLVALVSPEPFATCGSKTTSVVVRVRNFSCSPKTNIPVTVTVTGAVSPNPTTLNAIIPGPLGPGSSIDYSMGTINTPSVGTIVVNGSTTLPNDEDNGNNSFGTVSLQLKSAPLVNMTLSNANLVTGFNATIGGSVAVQSPSAYFANNFNTTISDNVVGNFAANSPITISGLPPGTLASSIKSVTVSLQHPFVSELRLRLQAPDGSEIILKNEYTSVTPNANMINTVFIPTATTPIAAGSVPFNGPFLPEESFSGLTGLANGTWKLYMSDYYIQNSGTLLNWSVSFDNGLSSASWTCPTCPTAFPVNFSAPVSNVNFPGNPFGAAYPAGSYVVSLSASDYQGCTATNDTTINFFTSNTWLGVSNSPIGNNWTNPANWNAFPSPPTSTVAVTIEPNKPFAPSVSGSVTAGTVNLKSGAGIQFTSGTGVINVAANWDGGNGTVTGPGTVNFVGIGGQTITGSTTFDNLSVTKTGGALNVNGIARVKGVVTLANSTSNLAVGANGKLILASDASGTGKIGPVPSGSLITGNITIERHIPFPSGSSGNWFFLGSPMAGKNFTDWVDNFKVTGLSTGFGSQGSGIISSSQPERSSIFKLIENQHAVKLDTVQKNGWRIPGNENIQPGTGYRVFISRSSNHNGKFDNVGTVTTGLFNFPTLTRTVVSPCYPSTPGFNPTVCRNSDEGFNLLANPYPCPINWDATGGAWVKQPNMNNAFYTWNAAAGGYRVYVASSPGIGLGSVGASPVSDPNIIPSGQAFFVKVTSGLAASLSVNESAKVTSVNGSFVRMASSVSNQSVIQLSQEGSTNKYNVLFRLMEQATDGFDQHLDAVVFSGSDVSFGLQTPDGNSLVAYSTDGNFETKTIPVLVNYNGKSGSFTFRFDGLESFDSDVKIYMKDNYLGTLSDLMEENSYVFTVENLPGSDASDRFEVIVSRQFTQTLGLIPGTDGFRVFPNPAESRNAVEIHLRNALANAYTLRIQDVTGKLVYSQEIEATTGKSLQKSIRTNLPAGMYQIQLISQKGSHQSKLILH